MNGTKWARGHATQHTHKGNALTFSAPPQLAQRGAASGGGVGAAWQMMSGGGRRAGAGGGRFMTCAAPTDG